MDFFTRASIQVTTKQTPGIYIFIHNCACYKSKGMRYYIKMKTKGATSHIDVSLQDLNNALAPTATVRVARRWAETIGITGIRPARPDAPKVVAVQAEEEPKTKLDLEVDTW